MPSEPQLRVTYAVARLERLMRRHLDEIVRRHDLTVPQYTTMSVLARGAGLSGAQLARRAFVTPQSVSVIIRDLSAAGLITRAASERHGRALTTSLTPKGRRVLRACDRGVDALERVLFEDDGAGELGRVREVLDAWTHRLAAAAAVPIDQEAGAGPRDGRPDTVVPR